MTKKISLSIFILAMMIAFAFDAYQAEAIPHCRKVYSYEYTANEYSWHYITDDEWGGMNYQCITPGGNQCGKWDWLAVYPLEINAGNPIYEDPCPGNNNPEYGHGLVVGEAGAFAPPYLPTFSMIYVD